MAQVTPPADGAAPKKPRTTKPATAGAATPGSAPAAKTPAAKTPAAKTPAAKTPAAKTPAAAKAPVAVTEPAAPAAPVGAPAIPAPATAPAAAATVPSIPTPPADGSAPAYAAPPARRKVWPWVLGGGIVLLVLLIVGVSVLVGTVLNLVGGSSQPSATVIAFDQSYKDADCTLFKSTTTKSFRDTFFDGVFTCDQWVDVANGLHDNGDYNYTVDVHETKVNGDSADVTTSEKDTTPGAEESYELDYALVKSNGGWLIDGITTVG